MFTWTLLLLVLAQCHTKTASLNLRPIIGIVAQKTSGVTEDLGDTYIQNPYVTYLEQAGARVVPLDHLHPLQVENCEVNSRLAVDGDDNGKFRLEGVDVGPTSHTAGQYVPLDMKGDDKDDNYYQFMFDRINGMLLPGGAASIVQSGYSTAARAIYDLAIKANDKGDIFPIWGTCLGFEQLTNMTAGEDLLVDCKGENLSLPLNFVTDSKQTRLFRDMDVDLMHELQKSSLTYNHHQKCIRKDTFQDHKILNSFYRLISINDDLDGLTFVSSIEAFDYPFYGVQWHPEKNNFFWETDEFINHTLSAVKLSQYMANFFVQQSRQSLHHFSDPDQEADYMIQRDNPVNLGAPYFYSVYIYNYTHNDTIMFYGFDLAECAGRLQAALVLLMVIFLAASTGIVLRQHCLAKMKGQPGVIVLADSKLLRKVKLGWQHKEGEVMNKSKDPPLLSSMHLHGVDMGIM